MAAEECRSYAESTWAAVARLDVVAEFAEREMSVGFFKYDSDAHDVMGPATWVFFLCWWPEVDT